MTGAELRAARRALGLTQAEVADRVGVTKAAVCMWEGRSPPPGRVAQLVEVLDCAEPRVAVRVRLLAADVEVIEASVGGEIGATVGALVRDFAALIRKTTEG